MEILYLIILLLAVIAIGVSISLFFAVRDAKKHTIIIEDTVNSDNTRDAWLKLQNEGKKYLTIKDGKVSLKILK